MDRRIDGRFAPRLSSRGFETRAGSCRISGVRRCSGAPERRRDKLAAAVGRGVAVYSWRCRLGGLAINTTAFGIGGICKQPKLVGVRHIVQSEPDERFLLQPEFLRGVSLLEEYDLAYDILIYPKHLPVAVEFVRKFPRQRLVLDHLAKPRIKEQAIHPWAEGIRELAVFPNVYCKMSGLVTEAHWKDWKLEDLAPYLEVALESFGPERLMIGSDWPVCTVAASYSRTVNAVVQYLSQLREDVREKVLGANAQKFYKLRVPFD